MISFRPYVTFILYAMLHPALKRAIVKDIFIAMRLRQLLRIGKGEDIIDD